MNQRILVKNLGGSINQIVTVMGFVKKIRNQKHVQFIILSDHTGEVQVVHSKTSNHEMATIIGDLTPGSTIHVTGLAVSAPQVKLNGVEIQLQSIGVDSIAKTPLPTAPVTALPATPLPAAPATSLPKVAPLMAKTAPTAAPLGPFS